MKKKIITYHNIPAERIVDLALSFFVLGITLGLSPFVKGGIMAFTVLLSLGNMLIAQFMFIKDCNWIANTMDKSGDVKTESNL